MAGRDANRGQCAQPCRWKYYLSEENRPGQLYEIGENENGSYILNANDMCTAPFIDLICKAGVDSLKIEGRAKTFYYVASVTAAYRKALDAHLADPTNDNLNCRRRCTQSLPVPAIGTTLPVSILAANRPNRPPTAPPTSASGVRGHGGQLGKRHCPLPAARQWSLGDTLEALCPDGRSIPLTPEWIENEAGSGWKAPLTPWKNTPCPPRSCRP